MKEVFTLQKHHNRLLQAILVASLTLLPWSATAIHQDRVSTSKLFKNQTGKDLVEKLLVKSLVQISRGETKPAMDTINTLIKTAPNYKLAHLIRGDLLSAQGRPLNAFGNTTIDPKQIEGLREEARTRLNYYFSVDNTRKVPNIDVQMAKGQQHLILIDTAKSRLFVYKKTATGLKYHADYYVTIGKNGANKWIEGDKRTPTGLYFTDKKITSQLSDFYGNGAYPLNYPNELDLHQNKTGYGIWLHGTPKDTYSRPPRASDGCVVLSNPDLNQLVPILKAGNVPVIISDKVEWLDQKQVKLHSKDINSLNAALNKWRKDWISQNTSQYLNNYAPDFFYSGGSLPEWREHKQRVQASKPKIKVNVSNISMYSYPNLSKLPEGIHPHQKIIVVNFDQYYESPTLKDHMRKRQYWVKDNNQWKIIYEGAA